MNEFCLGDEGCILGFIYRRLSVDRADGAGTLDVAIAPLVVAGWQVT